MTDCEVNRHRHAVFTISDLLAYGVQMQWEKCLIAVKLRCIWINIREPTVMNDRSNALSHSFLCELFPLRNSTSDNVMVEMMTSKQIKIIQFARSTFKFNSWDRIPKDVKKGPLAMLRSEIVNSLKESVQCNWNDKDNSKTRPPESSDVA